MSTITQILNYTLDHWEVWLAYAGGSAGIAVVVQIIKKKFKLDSKLTVWKVDAQKFIVALLGVVSAVAAVADVVITNASNNTILQLLPQAATVWPWLVSLAVVIHRFMVSGTWKKLENFLLKVSDYQAYKASLKPVEAVPTQPPVNFEG